MKKLRESGPLMRLIDAVLGDVAVRSAMYVARRREDGDAETFVIQTGEDGRFRLGLPDPVSDISIEALWPKFRLMLVTCSEHRCRVVRGTNTRCSASLQRGS